MKIRRSDINWKVCHCGCNGYETIYRGRYFWYGRTMGTYLVSTKHAHYGFHVGKFKSASAMAKAIRAGYSRYDPVPEIPWHLCGCGKCTRESACYRHLRFWCEFDSYKHEVLRYRLFRTHKGKRAVGTFTARTLEREVRRIARLPRKAPKRRQAPRPVMPIPLQTSALFGGLSD